jgi:hypothetical protein
LNLLDDGKKLPDAMSLSEKIKTAQETQAIMHAVKWLEIYMEIKKNCPKILPHIRRTGDFVVSGT